MSLGNLNDRSYRLCDVTARDKRELNLGAETKFPSNASHNSISIQTKLSLEDAVKGYLLD
jgi:hypothetical protein